MVKMIVDKVLLSSQAECLRETFGDLDMTSDVIKILTSPDAPYLQLSTFGHCGSINV